MPRYQNGNKRASKLTLTQVKDMRELYARGDCTQGQLARDYKVSVIQVGRILRGESWQGVGEASPSPVADDPSAILQRVLAVQEEIRSPGMDKLNAVHEKLHVGDRVLGELDEAE